jgi:predicted HD superfamily hydrolase involved in NAD metabolism
LRVRNSIGNKIKEIKIKLEEMLTPKRFIHSISTGKLAGELCKRYKIDPELGEVSGLLHDCAREFPLSDMKVHALKDGLGLNDWEEENHVLYHGRAGAVLAQEMFNIYNQQVIEAIRCHSVGSSSMDSLSKIIFISDFLEPERKFLPERKRMEYLSKNIDEMMFIVLERTLSYMKSKTLKIAQPALDLYNQLSLEEKN